MPDYIVFLRTTPPPGEQQTAPLFAQAVVCPADTGEDAVEAVLVAHMLIPGPGVGLEAIDLAEGRIYDIEVNPSVVVRPIPEATHPIVLPDEPPDDAHPEHPIVEPEPVEPEPTPPAADFTFAPAAPKTNDAVSFDATTSSGAGELSYAWAFEGGQGGASADGPVVEHAWDKKGSYDVSLVITDENEQTDQQDQTVKVT